MTSTISVPLPASRQPGGDTIPHHPSVQRPRFAGGMPTTLQEPTPPHIKHELEDERARGRPRSYSNDKESNSDGTADDANGDGDADADGDANGDHISNSDGPIRKRRRSRKGLDKKFECPHTGCGKSYSRAEHLHRHQLNHTPKQIYMCDFPGCERHFVRLDLCNRHRDRHTVKGSSLNRKETVPNQSSPVQEVRPAFPLPRSVSPDGNRPISGYGRLPGVPPLGPSAYSPTGLTNMPPYSPMAGTPPMAYTNGFNAAGAAGPARMTSEHGLDYAARESSTNVLYAPQPFVSRPQTQPPYRSPPVTTQRPTLQTANLYQSMPPALPQQPYPVARPSSTPQSAGFVLPQNLPPFDLPPSNFTAQQQQQQQQEEEQQRRQRRYQQQQQQLRLRQQQQQPLQQQPLQQQPQQQQPQQQQSISTFMPGEKVPLATSTDTPYAPDTSVVQYDAEPQSSEMMALDQMAIPNTAPIFGTDSTLQNSPYVGLPEDLIRYLFNNTPQEGSPMRSMALVNGNGDVASQYNLAYPGYDVSQIGQIGCFPAALQQVMSVTNLLDQNPPESVLSEEKSQEIFDLIRERFHEHGHTPLERRNETITDGDRSDDSHMLSRRMMQAYIGSYWQHFSDQVPILHQPTFVPDRTPNLLLVAIMAIGAACLDKTHGQKVLKAGAQLSNFLAWYLRWELFMDSNFRPPAKLWIFQALLLLELYEKMYSTREMHERAHIHHATAITLMRRGRALIGKTAAESPPSARNGERDERGSRHSSTSGTGNTADQWWDNWITNEATRRTAFAAFVMDSIHATMFGHSTVMVAHEMRLPLPCADKLWKARSGAEVGRAEAQLASEGFHSMSFLEGLKRTLNRQEVKTNAFGRTVLMAGLLSVSWHMHQRDLQVNSLGGPQGLGGRDKWRSTLTRAYDAWKADFDKAVQQQEEEEGRGSGGGGGGGGMGGGSGSGLGSRFGSSGGGRNGRVVDPYAVALTGPDEAEAAGQGGLGNVEFESRVVLHHLAHMATHVDVVDLQTYARAKRLLGRAIGPQALSSAQRRMTDVWAPTARARDATFYALQFLCSVLLRNEGNSPQASGFGYASYPMDGEGGAGGMENDAGTDDPEYAVYSARDNFLLHRPWVLYFASLVVWSYGHALEGPCPNAPVPMTWPEKVRHMREYLHRFGSVPSPDALKGQRGINQNNGLLLVLKESFSHTRWELLHEGARLLGNCVQLNRGLMV